MLSQIRIQNARSDLVPVPSQFPVDDRWGRDMKEDMKTALDLVWKLKEGLDKLHPECIGIIEKMLSSNNHF